MRSIPLPAICVLLLLFSAAGAQDSVAVTKRQPAGTAGVIAAKEYVFQAQTATPMSGRVLQLTYGYELKVMKDTVVAYLPYFGRAYAAPTDPTKGGIQFTAAQFTYNVQERKKGGWDISIVPSDGGDVRQLTLSVSKSGYSTLQVLSNNRQPISFYGIVTGLKRKK